MPGRATSYTRLMVTSRFHMRLMITNQTLATSDPNICSNFMGTPWKHLLAADVSRTLHMVVYR